MTILLNLLLKQFFQLRFQFFQSFNKFIRYVLAIYYQNSVSLPVFFKAHDLHMVFISFDISTIRDDWNLYCRFHQSIALTSLSFNSE